ncbi:MAG: hypothetical protein KDA42_07305 [Planctomycetales bacterium]|nr:hypothetical protein [Planctomycetales bacterium]
MPQESSRISTRRKLLFATVAVLVPLLLLESLLRVGKTVADDLSSRDAEWYEFDTRVGWRPRPNFSGTIIHGYREFDAHGYVKQDSAQVAPRNRELILVVGDSTAMGFGVPVQQSFAEQLDRLLPEQDVVNLGVNGYSSLQTAIRLEQALEVLKPSAVIVSCGFNDRRYVLREELRDSPEHFLQIGQQRPAWYDSFYLYRGLRKLLVAESQPPRDVTLTMLPARVGPGAYRENVRRMGTVARRHNARLVLLALHDNPTKSRDLRAGISALDDDDAPLAIEHLRRAVQAANMFADLGRIYLAQAYQAEGNDEKAKKALQVRIPLYSLHGGRPVHLDREYEAILFEVAAETGATVVAAGERLDESPGVYFDFCHFDEIGNRIVAEMLAEELDDAS